MENKSFLLGLVTGFFLGHSGIGSFALGIFLGIIIGKMRGEIKEEEVEKSQIEKFLDYFQTIKCWKLKMP